ncbi:MAG: eight transrane protein EpsH [Verrucomicrobia bacterium]|nr:eight transrane protein EpsH [Verrucomicrobiota bacterium]
MKHQRLILGMAAFSLMLITAGLIHRLHSQQQLGAPGVVVAEAKTDSGFEVVLPEKVLDYTSEKQGPLPEELGMLPKDTTYGRRRYVSPDGFVITISVVLMGTDRTSIHRPEFCLTGQGWKIDEAASGVEGVKLAGDTGKTLDYNRMLLGKDLAAKDGTSNPARALYLYWFVAEGRETPGQGQRMWWMASDLVRSGKLQRWAYVSYSTACRPDQEKDALERVRKFIAASVPEFQISAGASTKMASGLREDRPSTMLTERAAPPTP